MALITAAEFAEYRKDISKGWQKEQEKIERCIEEAESADLYDVLGPFYFEVVQNAVDATYEDLMNGSTFEYEGNMCMHIGIKKYLAGLAYVRYLTLANMVHTTHGLVTKLNNDSEPLEINRIRDIRKEVQKLNEIEFERIDMYLRANASKFPKYRKGNNPHINSFSISTSTLR